MDSGTSWVDAAVSQLGQPQIEAWTAAEVRLRAHGWRIATLFRLSGHVEPAGSEALAAALGRALEAPLDLYRSILTSDLSWPAVTTRDGSKIVDFLSYADLRRDLDHDVRDQVNRAYFQRMKALEQPLGLLLVHRYETERDLAQARGFENGIDAFFSTADAPMIQAAILPRRPAP